jgi:ABC-2 type transport system permease protein
MSVIFFASGQLVPLWMYPPWLRSIVNALPFKDIYYIPQALYIDAFPGTLLEALRSQLIWVVVLLGAGRLFWVYVQRRITVQGG